MLSIKMFALVKKLRFVDKQVPFWTFCPVIPGDWAAALSPRWLTRFLFDNRLSQMKLVMVHVCQITQPAV